MPNQFFPAPEVEAIGRELIREFHDHLISHNVRVEFCFCSETQKKGGFEVWGTAQKISGKNAFLYQFKDAETAWQKAVAKTGGQFESEKYNEAFFLITISAPIWDKLKKNPDRQRALVDHELMHCHSEIDDESGEVKLSILSHDFEGFNKEMERHGLWRENAAKMLHSMQEGQMSLFEQATAAVQKGVESVTFKANGESVTVGRKKPAGHGSAVVH
jgi:hypothetical protein